MSDFAERLGATLVGGVLGIGTGLLPGIHVNTVALLLVGWNSNPLYLSLIIVSLAVSHTFWECIPATILGAPREETAFGILPGHRLLVQGRGYEAIWLLLTGGVAGVFLAFLCSPLLLFGLPLLYQLLLSRLGPTSILTWVLTGMVGLLLASERHVLHAVLIFFLSGVLGWVSFQSPLSSTAVFFPLFTGLFGMSHLLQNLKDNAVIPSQTMIRNPLSHWSVLAILKGMIGGILVGTLPGVGSSHAATVLHMFTRRRDEREFLLSLGAISTITALFSIVALYTIAAPRSGAAISIQTLLPSFGFGEFLLVWGSAMMTVGVMGPLALWSTPYVIRFLQRFPSRMSSCVVILLLLSLTILWTGWLGLLILFTGTSLGFLPSLWGVKRSCMMGVLLVPVLLFYVVGI